MGSPTLSPHRNTIPVTFGSPPVYSKVCYWSRENPTLKRLILEQNFFFIDVNLNGDYLTLWPSASIHAIIDVLFNMILVVLMHFKCNIQKIINNGLTYSMGLVVL